MNSERVKKNVDEYRNDEHRFRCGLSEMTVLEVGFLAHLLSGIIQGAGQHAAYVACCPASMFLGRKNATSVSMLVTTMCGFAFILTHTHCLSHKTARARPPLLPHRPR